MSPLKIEISSKDTRKNQQMQQLFIQFINYVSPTCFGITLPSSESVPSAFW
jgi:hypothetical protein